MISTSKKMLKTSNIITALFLFVLPGLGIHAQEIAGELTLEKAIAIAMGNNHNLKIAENQLQQVKNNNTLGNAGLLPSVALSGGIDYTLADTENETLATGVVENNGIGATGYNAAARAEYTLFDGFGNRYYYKKLQQRDMHQQTIFLQQIENTMLSVVNGYYTVCSAQQNLKLARESMQISKDRYQKALDRRSYGQANRLDVLNAEVDMNSDSTRILNAEQNYVIAIKNLNVVLGISVSSDYSVDESIEFNNNQTEKQVIEAAMVHNSFLQSQQQQEGITELDLKIVQSNKYPSLSAYGQYA